MYGFDILKACTLYENSMCIYECLILYISMTYLKQYVFLESNMKVQNINYSPTSYVEKHP